MSFNIGDRVIYVSGVHTLGKSNPLWGSEHSCMGTVCEFRHGETLFYRVKWDNGYLNNYKPEDLRLYKLEKQKKGKVKMDFAFIKETAKKTYSHIKPYEKYIGLIALAVVIDHFLLGNKFSSRFKSLAESVVSRITDMMDTAIERVSPKIEEKIDGGK